MRWRLPIAQNVGVLQNGTTSITGGVSALITGLGSQAQQINTAQTAQAAVNAQALTSVQSASGVNLDEEAAKPVAMAAGLSGGGAGADHRQQPVHHLDRFSERHVQLKEAAMRVTQSLEQTQFLAAIGSLESGISQTQNQMSSGLSFTTASQNPTAAGSVNNYNQALAQSQQYGTNATSAQTNLNTEDSALSQVQTQLQSLRDLALEANSGILTSSNLSAIATQAVQIQNSLLALANTTNGNGEYIFGGFAAQTQPFTLTATGATYNGDQGQRQVQIAAGQTVADGDNGNTVFNQIKTGNGTFTVSAAAGNTGSGIVGATTVSNPAAI